MQALTFPTNAFLHSSQDICQPWRVLKQYQFPGPLRDFSSQRKIYTRISALFSSCFVPELARAHCLQQSYMPMMVENHSETRTTQREICREKLSCSRPTPCMEAGFCTALVCPTMFLTGRWAGPSQHWVSSGFFHSLPSLVPLCTCARPYPIPHSLSPTWCRPLPSTHFSS